MRSTSLPARLLRGAVSRQNGMVLLTSRVSVEMVQKTAVIGAPLIVAVSAPTALAVRTAEAAGITLAAVARSDGFEIFTHPQRIKETQQRNRDPCRLTTSSSTWPIKSANSSPARDRNRAVTGTAEHIKKFWDPRMRAAIFAHLAEGGAGLDPVVRTALERLAGAKTEATEQKAQH